MSYHGHYRSWSHSQSPKCYKSHYSYSRFHSYSPCLKYYGYSDRRKEFCQSHSRSPMSSRRWHVGSRVSVCKVETFGLHLKCVLYHTNWYLFQDNPQPSRCLGIFGLSIYTTEQQLHHIMLKYGHVERVQVVIDAKVGPGISDSVLCPCTPRVGNHHRMKLWHVLDQWWKAEFWEDIEQHWRAKRW